MRLARMAPTSRHSLCSGWPRMAGLARSTMMHNDATPRGCRPAELYEHNLDPTCTPDSTNACISTLRELSTDILSFRDSLRSCLSNVPPRVSYPTPLEPIHPQFSHSSGFLLTSHSTLAQSRFQRSSVVVLSALFFYTFANLDN
jgi:hypothetical protein